MHENPKRCETIKALAELCEMKFRAILGSQLESWEPEGCWDWIPQRSCPTCTPPESDNDIETVPVTI